MDETSQAAFEVERVIWIEPDPNRADIAFLQLKSSGSDRKPVRLAKTDASPSTDVVVIGYPGKAAPKAIPDQQLMEKIFTMAVMTSSGSRPGCSAASARTAGQPMIAPRSAANRARPCST